MTRHQRFDVRVAPPVLEAVAGISLGVPQTRRARAFADAMERLRREGTRAHGAKKLKGLDLWEIRADEWRAFFVPVPRGRRIAVGAILAKRSRRVRMSRLKHIERVVHDWSDQVEADR